MSSVTYTYRFMAYLKWGGTDRQPTQSDVGLPPEFLACRESWLAMAARKRWSKKELARIHAVVGSRLECLFIPLNLKGGLDSLLVREDFWCPRVDVTGVDFSDGPIPTICAKAFFELPFAVELADSAAFWDWQEANDYLDWAIVFRYDFDLNDEEFVFADRWNSALEIYGPLSPDDPGRTYAEEIRDILKGAAASIRTI